MAFLDSINFNGKSVRDFLTEIIEVRGRGKPRIRKRSSRIIGRHGDFTFGQTYAPRIIRISGYVEGASHATLMLNVDNIKNLFSMDDQILSTGEESISDGVKYGKLVFGDETDRYYRAIYNGINVLTEISQRWFLNDLKRIQIELRCDDPFAYATSLSESTMAGSADEFKVFDLGTANNEVIIELSGSVTNPVIVEGDKVGVAHFDYNDDLTDVEVNTIAGSFEEIFGFRTRKSLTSQQSKAIQLVSKDNLYYDRGANINGQNYVNFNPYQGTLIFWVKPYFDGDDPLTHHILTIDDAGNNSFEFFKRNNDTLQFNVKLGATPISVALAVDSANFGAGKWHQIVARWDTNNGISGTANTIELELNQGTPAVSTSALGTPNGLDAFLAFGQFNNATPDGSINNFDGLIHWQFYERALIDSEVTALFNSGAGVEPFVTPDTKLLSAGELSGGLPVSVQYPWVDNKIPDGNQEVDPATEWAINTNVVVTNETTIVKYDLQSAKIVWSGAVTDEGAQLSTVALVNNQDYFYRIWVFVETLNASDELVLKIDGSSTVVTRRLDTGIDDMGVAFATGKWLYYEGTFEADGNIAHTFRLEKTNTNGDATVYIDQMDVQVSLVDNGSMEGTYSGGFAELWQSIGTAVTATEENVIVHSGTAAQKFTAGGSSERGIRQTAKNDLIAGQWYTFSFWLKSGAGTEDILIRILNSVVVFEQTITNASTDWTKYYATFKAGASATVDIRILISQTGGIFYFDDASIMELDIVTANAASAPTSEIDSYSEEKFKQGLRIDGADILSWDLVGNKNEGSVEVWFKPQFAADWDDDTFDPTIFLYYFNGANYTSLFYDWTGDKWVFRKRAAATNYDAEAPSQVFTKNQRIHIIGTYGSGGVKIYVDSGIGSVVNSNTTVLNSNPNILFLRNEDLSLGRPDSIIDEIYVYSRELSQQEVTAKFNAIRATKNDNAKIAMTKVLNTNDKLRIDTENEIIEFLDSSAGTFTNAIASMDAGSNFFKMHALKSVIYSKVAITNTSVVNKIKLNYLKRWL